MKRKRPFSGIKVKYKLILSIYLVIAPIILVVSGYNYAVNYRNTTDAMTSLYQNLVEVADENISYLNSDVLDLMTYIGVNTDVNKLLSGPAEELGNNAWVRKAPMNFVRDTLSIKGHIRTLIIYPENGGTPFYISNDKSVHNTNLEEIRASEAYTNAQAARGDTVYTSELAGDTSLFTTNKGDKLILSRMMFDLSKQNKLGYICVGIDLEQYNRICENVLQNENECVLVVSDTGMVLARGGQVSPALEAYAAANATMMRAGAGNGYIEYDGSYIFNTQGDNGFSVYYGVPKANWTSQLAGVFLLPVALLLAMLVVLWPLSMFASRIISTPLGLLYDSMSKFREGDFTQQVETDADDEIGELTRHFNQMVLDIKELVDKNYVMVLNEQQSELNALQAQINPHFLYNTLDSLFWRAYNEGFEELAEDIYVLSKLFRLVLSRGEDEIPLSREVELVGHYLHIQKMRFGKKLNYIIDVDESILQTHIPKLILQPFVENAIVHGLESTGKEGKLIIKGIREDDKIHLTVADNGVGITEDKLQELLEGREDASYASERLGRYAIHNVRQRLALRYREFGFDIESEAGKGTIVHLILPIEQEAGEWKSGQ